MPMIRRIERFTTHTIAPAVIAGMEPRMVPTNEPWRERPAGGRGKPGARSSGRPARTGDRPAGRAQGPARRSDSPAAAGPRPSRKPR
jgi:hypothetical protein